MTAPLIAIVGRPNVGKSTLFNRLVGGRPALVHDTPGLTRDRRYGEADYFGAPLRIVDTGGLDPDAERDVIGAGIHRQAMHAIGEADALVLVVDGRAGISALDHDLANKLRTTGKPLFLAINKVDHPANDHLVHDFHELGISSAYAVSAAHGRGIDALLEAIVAATGGPPPVAPEPEDGDDLVGALDAQLDGSPEETDDDREPLRVAFVGRPNAGKSSLTNRLLGEERSLVHHVAGTTTDPVDTPFSIGKRDYVLIDTAGIRRKARIDVDIEKIAVSMALGQIQRADVVVLVIDAEIGAAEQDGRIAGMVEESGRALVIALNKSDRAHCLKLAFEVAPNSDFGEMAKELASEGIRSELRNDATPGVGQVLAFADDKGTIIELFKDWSYLCKHEQVAGIGPLKLGHVAFFTPDIRRTVAGSMHSSRRSSRPPADLRPSRPSRKTAM
ncbi:MAG TPA: ribosome biogenesis GTPase Der, partial [Kofleriaceae bacterium]|nr:ribosome biogenesis GTPase Der [Kofleriaceae bacterium]